MSRARKQVIRIFTPKVGPRSNQDPAVIGDFRVLGLLGRGGFGSVYLATRTLGPEAGGGDDGHGRQFAAVKVVRPIDGIDPDSFKDRFAKEVAAIERAAGEYAPKLVGKRIDENEPWLATELIAGLSLDKVLDANKGPLPEGAVWELGAGIADALAAVHAARLFHRDIKPHNVLITPDRPWIIDFGLAHLTDTRHLPSSQLAMATPQYAAPEQLNNGLSGAEAPADVYGLGATLLYAATSNPPRRYYSGASLSETPDLRKLPRGLHDLVDSCLHYSPDARPKLDELRAEIARHTQGGPPRQAFAAALPAAVHEALTQYQDELAKVLGARGPARLGWSTGHPEAADEAGGQEEPARPLEEPGLPGIRSLDVRALRPQRVGAPEHPATVDGTASTVGLSRWTEGPARPAGPGRRGTATPGGGWTRKVSSGWICAAVAVHGDLCVLAGLDGLVKVLRTTDGSSVWPSVNVGGRVYGSVAVYESTAFAPSGGGARNVAFAAFAAVADGRVCAIDLSNGQLEQVLPPDSPVEGPPVVVQDLRAPRVYVARADGSVLFFDPRTRENEELCRLDNGATGALAATDTMVFAADASGQVHLIDVHTKRSRRPVTTDGQVLAAPLPVADRLYVAGTDGWLREADLASGTVLREFDLGAPVHVPPVHTAGVLYIGDSGGTVHAYQVDGGAASPLPQWSAPRLGLEIVGLAVSPGMVYAACGYQVLAFDGSTGAPRGQVAELECLIAAAPVIDGRFCYVTGLGGVVKRVPLERTATQAVLSAGPHSASLPSLFHYCECSVPKVPGIVRAEYHLFHLKGWFARSCHIPAGLAECARGVGPQPWCA